MKISSEDFDTKNANADQFGNPLISVIIATRNRGDSVVATLASLLNNSFPNFEVLVIDQSETSSTRDAVAQFESDRRFKYFYSSIPGSARARNLGISKAKASIIAMTDDDCEVPPNWLASIAMAFAANPDIGLLFGSTVAAPYDVSKGYIPDYPITKDKLYKVAWKPKRVRGMGACMAIRRQTWEVLEGFDEMLGPGGILMSGEDTDIAIRTLLCGQYVLETPSVKVLHFGYRDRFESRNVVYRDAVGLGAALIKPVRGRHFSMVVILLTELFVEILRPMLINLVRLKRPFHLKRLKGFLVGVIRGLQTPVNNQNLHYLSPHEIAA